MILLKFLIQKEFASEVDTIAVNLFTDTLELNQPLDAGTYDINTAGSAFSFQESFIGGDAAYAVGSGVDVASGIIADLPVLSKTTSYSGGVAGNLAGTVTSAGLTTVVAGGAGTTGIAQFVTELSVLD